MMNLRFLQTLNAAKLLTLVSRDLAIDSAGRRDLCVDELCDTGNQVEGLFDAAIAVVLADGTDSSMRELLRAIQVLEETDGDPSYVGLCVALLNSPLDGDFEVKADGENLSGNEESELPANADTPKVWQP
jgi:hypothetical protein